MKEEENKTYKIPVTWLAWGVMSIEADSLKAAKEKALGSAPLPEANYVDDSIEIDEANLEDDQ